MKKTDIPYQGMLEGLRVAFSAPSAAGPFAAALCADFGADVYWLEKASMHAIERGNKSGWLDSERRNMRSIGIDIPSPEGREVFFRLLKNIDILIESSKGGQWKRWGLSDEVLWEVNPKLIIAHVSGFGLSGEPDYVSRASYDPVAQAFGGMMYANMQPGQTPMAAQPIVADYYTGLYTFGTMLAAYIRMLKTGKGESIDLAQYETCVRCSQYAMNDWNFPVGTPGADIMRYKHGIQNYNTAGFNCYECKDGNYIYALLYGASVFQKLAPVLGFEYGSEEFPARQSYFLHEPWGQKYEQLVRKYFSEHTAEEAEKELSELGCPVMRNLSFDDMLTHPHYIARETITSIDSKTLGREVKIPNIFPKVTNSPGKIWRAAPEWGEDTEDIMEELGYTPEEINKLAEDKVIHKA